MQDNGPSVGFALAGGLVLSVGNLATQYGWPFVGVSATGVISSSIAVVVGNPRSVSITTKPHSSNKKNGVFISLASNFCFRLRLLTQIGCLRHDDELFPGWTHQPR